VILGAAVKNFVVALLAIAGLTVGLSQLASAADLPVKARQPARQQPAQQAPASTNWSGTQIGGNGGGSVANNAFVEPGSVACWPGSVFGTSCTETPFSFSGQGKSFVGGGFVGYNVQMANTVVGVEGDALWKKATTSSSQQSTALGLGPCDPCLRSDAFTGSISQGFEASIRARGGFLVTPSTLIYGTAGISFGQVSGSFTYQGILNFPAGSMATASGSWSDFRVGPTAGAGVETAIGPGLKLRLEYRYTSYGSYSKDIPLTTVCGPPGGCVFPSANSHINVPNVYNQKLMVGIGYNLGG
jgi:outer membrane immunogenic protein